MKISAFYTKESHKYKDDGLRCEVVVSVPSVVLHIPYLDKINKKKIKQITMDYLLANLEFKSSNRK